MKMFESSLKWACGTFLMTLISRMELGALRWRHNERDSVLNHQPHDCLLSRLFRRIWKRTSKLPVSDLCAGNSPGTGEFPAQMASNVENVSIWRRHHGLFRYNHRPCTWLFWRTDASSILPRKPMDTDHKNTALSANDGSKRPTHACGTDTGSTVQKPALNYQLQIDLKWRH